MNTISHPVSRSTFFDVGLLALLVVCQAHDIDMDLDDAAHELGLAGSRAAVDDLVKAARHCGLKSKVISIAPNQLSQIPLPAIVQMKDGAFMVIHEVSDSNCLLRDPLDVRPRKMNVADLSEDWSGTVLLFAKIEKDGDAESQFGFGWFYEAALRYKGPLVHALICSFFVQIFALVTPLFFQIIVDKVLVHRSVATLEVVVVSLVILNLFDVMLQYLRSYALYHTASRIDVELGSQVFARLFSLPLSYFETRATGQTVARLKEVETIRTFLTGQAGPAIIDALFTVIFLSVLFFYSVQLAIVVILTLPVYITIAAIIRPQLQLRIKERFNKGAQSSQFMVEAIVGAATLKSSALEPLTQKFWERKLSTYVRSSFQAVMLGSAGQSCIQFVTKLTTAMILYFGALQVFSGDMTVGQLIAFNMLAGQLTGPVIRLSQLWQDIQQMRISIERLGDIFNVAPEDVPGSKTRNVHSTLRGAIEFRNVTFRYSPTTPPILKNVNLSIPAGQLLGIVGESGSGKSTLTKLIQRLYVPETGNVFLDDCDVSDMSPASFRRQIGVVLQDNLLFNRTVHENIALANPGMPRELVRKVANLAGAHEFVTRLPKGYDSIIEERGANLSGGQRQRLAIARALSMNPKILILDEATSALDYDSERIIRGNMRAIAKGRTVVVVAHRLAAIRDCDRIITMKAGEILEDGTHEQLLSRPDGIYAHLWSLQSL